MKTRFVKWNWEQPSVEENSGHNQNEWGGFHKNPKKSEST